MVYKPLLTRLLLTPLTPVPTPLTIPVLTPLIIPVVTPLRLFPRLTLLFRLVLRLRLLPLIV